MILTYCIIFVANTHLTALLGNAVESPALCYFVYYLLYKRATLGKESRSSAEY